jgi:HPt (histidine-containing phosphotransfer) domain-containing protein
MVGQCGNCSAHGICLGIPINRVASMAIRPIIVVLGLNRVSVQPHLQHGNCIAIPMYYVDRIKRSALQGGNAMSESETRSAAEPIFTVDALLKYMGNDQKAIVVVAKIVSDALATGEQLLAVARRGVSAAQYAEAAHAFHGLRGSVGTLGAKRFVGAAMAAELAIIEHRHADVAPLLAVVESEFGLVAEQAAAWLARSAR